MILTAAASDGSTRSWADDEAESGATHAAEMKIAGGARAGAGAFRQAPVTAGQKL